YDGVQNPLPFQVNNGPSLNVKATPDNYVNILGLNVAQDIRTSGNFSAIGTGGGVSYFGSSVGIGTSNLGSNRLAVDGTIGARKVVVTLTNPFPDYVFEKDYPLPSLNDLDQYVRQNKHLPEVPSADSVAKNGLDL